MVNAFRTYQCTNSYGIYMMPVTYSLGIGAVRSHSGTYHTRFTVMQTAHAIVGMNKNIRTRINTGKCLVIRCIRVS